MSNINSNEHSTFQVASLGSGSKGNATLVSAGDTHILIDCGFTAKEAIKRLALLDFDAKNLSAILVTHEHQDHIKGAAVLSRRLQVPVFATQGTYLSGKLENCDFRAITPQQNWQFKNVQIEAFSVPHDAREPCQFIIEFSEKRLGVISDLGSITPPVIEKVASCHSLLLEMNHDYEMLMNGVYPYSLKQRVGGALGHLNNEQSLSLLNKLDFRKLELVVATHLSEQNNCPKLVASLLAETLETTDVKYTVASQQKGLHWHSLI